MTIEQFYLLFEAMANLLVMLVILSFVTISSISIVLYKLTETKWVKYFYLFNAIGMAIGGVIVAFTKWW